VSGETDLAVQARLAAQTMRRPSADASAAPAESATAGLRTGAEVPVLVDSTWCLDHLDDRAVRFVEVDERPGRGRFEQGHIPGAVSWVWDVDLLDPVERDIASREQLSELLARTGIDPTTHVVLYGDPSNWFAAWAYWLLKLHAVEKVSLLDGGRALWVQRGLPLTAELGTIVRASHPLPEVSFEQRAFRDDVLRHVRDRSATLLDVRSAPEYRGDIIAPPGMSETAQRAGHIPTAISIPWDETLNPDGTFKSRTALRALFEALGVSPDREVITYCRIGERSSHSWYVLHELLGYPSVRNYDGSWTEWGSSVGLPIER
jgi:thiosulfate/3-mercaptopyruvate sulfurtransferase